MKLKYLACAAIAAAGLIATVFATPALAQVQDTYVSSAGNDGSTCLIDAPCQTITHAIGQTTPGGTVHCVGSVDNNGNSLTITQSIIIDCSNAVATLPVSIFINTAGVSVTLYGLAIEGGINFAMGDSLLIRNCRFYNTQNPLIFSSTTSAKLDIIDTDFANNTFTAIFIEPGSGASIVAGLKNVNITGSGASGIAFNPGFSANITATLQNVSIRKNAGGGVKAVGANGAVTVDIADSVISGNGGNGVNALGSGHNTVINISHSTIANNGATGVQANGATAGVMVDTTLLDSNAGGAVSAIGGGHVLSYANNRIVGSLGTGFSSTVGLQ